MNQHELALTIKLTWLRVGLCRRGLTPGQEDKSTLISRRVPPAKLWHWVSRVQAGITALMPGRLGQIGLLRQAQAPPRNGAPPSRNGGCNPAPTIPGCRENESRELLEGIVTAVISAFVNHNHTMRIIIR